MDRSTRGALRVDAVWDIETHDWDQFVVGALWTAASGVEVFRTEDELAAALLALPQGFTAWAHSGGRFDVLWLMDWCYRHDCLPPASIRMSGPSISALAITGGPTLRDSYRLIPMSLAKASRMFKGGKVKAELGLACVCGKNCKGFCAVRRDMPADTRAKVEAYLVDDVESLRDTLVGLIDFTEGHRLVVRGTVAGSSWASARLHCDLQPSEWDLRCYRFARRGYYGGRVEAPITRAPVIHRYDRNSSYPAALRQPIPVGVMRLVPNATRARGCFTRARPGIYRATLQVPESLAPPLPKRVGERCTYPWGKVEGTWPRPEIEHAIACGARLVDVHECLVWADEQPLLKPYVEHVWTLRANAKAEAKARGEDPDKDPLAAWLKWLANSLTGAFAQDPEAAIFAIGDKADDAQWDSVGVHDWLWKRTLFKIADRAHVQFAATLTGYARIELHHQIRSAGDAWVYSDTDSVFATRELARNVGTDLGEWGYEGRGADWEALAPKVYRYTAEKPDGENKVIAKAKGVPNVERHWEALAAFQRVPITDGVRSFLQAAARGGPLFKRQDTSRKLAPPTAWCGARLRIDGDRTRAPSVAELAKLP